MPKLKPFSKVITGFVVQEFSGKGEPLSQEFVAGDDVTFERNGAAIDEPSNAQYMSLLMLNPGDETMDRDGTVKSIVVYGTMSGVIHGMQSFSTGAVGEKAAQAKFRAMVRELYPKVKAKELDLICGEGNDSNYEYGDDEVHLQHI